MRRKRNGGPLRFIARQPFDSAMQVYGYELLFRAGFEQFARIADFDAASHSTMDVSMEISLDTLCGGHSALVNCTREVLTSDFVLVLQPREPVLELLESVEADQAVVDRCAELKALGYKIALDDVISMERVGSLMWRRSSKWTSARHRNSNGNW